MRVELITHPSGDQLPIMLGADGLPVPAPNEFILTRRALSSNTLVRNLRELLIFYRWLDGNNIDLWERIRLGKGLTEAEVTGGIVEAIRRDHSQGTKVKRIAISPNTFNQRLITIRMYVGWCFDVVLSSLAMEDRKYDRIREQKKRVITWLEDSFINSPPVPVKLRKGIEVDELDFLLACFDPKNPNAIGRDPAVRFRNYISIMIMAYYGLRPGELLCLKVEDVEFGAISGLKVERRHPDPNDTRRLRPRIKRNGRVLPIDDPVFEKNLDEYIMKWREELESKSKTDTDYLILNDEGVPLSQSSLTQMFQIVRKKYPKQLPSHLTAKALRHTFLSQMEKILRQSGLDEDRRKTALAILRGDSSTKSQDVYIAQEIEEQANKSLKKYQQQLIMEDVLW